MVRQYQIVLDPDRPARIHITQQRVIDAVRKANQETAVSSFAEPNTGARLG